MRRTSTSATPLIDDPVTGYARDVVKKRIVVGHLVRLACKRHLDDLKYGHERGLRWDLPAALRAINFFPDVLRLSEGEHAGKPFILERWQKFIVGSLFGWKSSDGFRRFRNCYVEIGKGNGKSPLAGGLGLYMLTADGEAGAECYAAATMREQAGILFQDAVNMVDASPALSARLLKSGKRKVFNLAHMASGSYFRPVSSEGKGLDGKRVHFAAIDELHEHPTPIVDQKMRAGTKGRRQALILRITNSGWDRNSICYTQHEFSRKVLEGVLPNDQWFAYVCTLDPCKECAAGGKAQPDDKCDKCDDWRDEKVWLKVNPNLGVSVSLKYLRERVAEAEGMPTSESEVKRFNFCIWTESVVRWMDMQQWDACCGTVSPEELLGQTCYGGLDLALTRDLSAFVLLFPPTEDREEWAVMWFFWCPEDDVVERTKRDHVPYDLWVRQEKIIATPGNITDHDFIENKIKALRTEYAIRCIGYDPSRATQLVTHLQEESGNGDFMVQVSQNASNMHAAIAMLEKLALGKQLAHGGHPVARWNVSNAVTRKDANGNVRFDKEKAIERMDGASALGNAAKVSMAFQDEGPSVYETRGVVAI